MYNKAQTQLIRYAPSKNGSFDIPNSVITIGEYAFVSCNNLTSVTIPNSVTTLEDNAFYGSSLTSVIIPNSVTTIGQGAFSYCTHLTSATIPISITTIRDNTFYECFQLTLVTIPNSVTTIGENAFYHCFALDSVTLSNTLTTIGKDAFTNCHLTSISIPNTVTAIGENAFSYCWNLTSITVDNPQPVDLTSSANVFLNVDKSNCTLYVPAGSKTAYQAPTANQWNEFTNIVELTPTVINTPKNSNVTIVVTANQLAITNAPQGEMVVVYNLAGSVIYSQEVTNSSLYLTLPAHGVYIVKVGTLSKKVVY